MDHDIKGSPRGDEEDLNGGWPAFLAAARATDPNFESYGVARLADDYAMLRTKIAEAVQHATGHPSEELFKIGYMLSIVQERATYTIDDLAHVVSSDWVMPAGDLDLIDRVRDIISLPCNFAEELSQSGFQDFLKHVKEPGEIQDFLRRLDHVRTHPRRLPRVPTLSISEIRMILCAEIWCTWDLNNRSPLPSEVAFAELFGPGMALSLTAFGTRLAIAFNSREFKDYILRWYGFDVAILRNISALVDLVDGCNE